ncbi:ATP synthase F1 subunit epsilon [Enterovirga sp.]|uniref:ATP synthase F1 subunit epsilon n=1 Tax=Enterovirga sp. TaxID=2026350 RepID=UPI002C9D45AC|nr:ATP synthase F1 subunit epsilon [Enterovirga sp.]HMO29059.1 ATP synthase F1 subunit epsilon [Enterovirga sp.]
MATLHFELVAPERILFSGDVEAVMLPGTEGDMTVLPGHAPVMAMLKTGFVQITDHKDEGHRVLIRGGFAEINQEAVTVLAENATPVEEVTPESIAKEIERLELRRDATEDFKAQGDLSAAIAQLHEAREALKF